MVMDQWRCRCLPIVFLSAISSPQTRLVVGTDSPALSHKCPLPYRLPSEHSPFVFFHLRKCGGSTVRPQVADSAVALGLKFFIPCQEGKKGNAIPRGTSHGVSCNFYHFEGFYLDGSGKNVAVLAGHFYWNDVHRLSYWSAKEASTLPEKKVVRPYADLEPQFSCFILVRDPVSRFESCYRERFKPLLRYEVADIPASLLEDVLSNYTDGLHGCSNEIARFLSPVGWDDEVVNVGNISRDAIEQTKSRISKCIIGNTAERCDDTAKTVKHWFPWMKFACRNEGHKYTGERTALPSAARSQILKHNELDVALYNYSMRLFEEQLACIR